MHRFKSREWRNTVFETLRQRLYRVSQTSGGISPAATLWQIFVSKNIRAVTKVRIRENGAYQTIKGNSGSTRNAPSNYSAPHPNENRRAAHTSFILAELSCATRFPRRCCDTVTALCRFTAHGLFIPSSSFSTTSDGTPQNRGM